MPGINGKIHIPGFHRVVFVAPGNEHTHLSAGHGCGNVFNPIVRILKTLNADFGNSCRFYLLVGKRLKQLQVVKKYRIVDADIAVHAYEIDIIVTGPAEQEVAFAAGFEVDGRRYGIQEIKLL